ncbi:ABC transporter ATP-binding protein [Vagococcus zengguangii]|uniref:ABC transporter ATP-binding protein n=1 Tax=Vagococcus zengguangii TaxID=2571750 RepID=UPI0011099293|nr:ABC transporter ATP-binding protein [Vagococcus zengguangii]TLG80884.1 ABC transporter ATP-binding protein [Vagococcus zengguangii]
MVKTFGSLKRLWSYLRLYKVGFFLAILCEVTATIVNALFPVVVGLPTTRIAQNIANKETIDFDYIVKILILITIMSVICNLGYFGSNALMSRVVQRSMRDLRRDISHKINRLPVSYFDSHQRGDILSRMTNDVDSLTNALQQSLLRIISATIGMTSAIFMMFKINTKLALLSMLMIPASVIISKVIVSKSQKYFKAQQDALGDLNSYVQENMTGFAVLKLFGREKENYENFKTTSHKLSEYGFKSSFISGLMMPLVQLTSYLVYIIVAVLGGLLVINKTITLGNLQAFIQYVWQLNQPMGQVTQLSAVIQGASASTKRIFTVLDEQEEPDAANLASLPATIQGAVTFEHVSFSYDPAKPLIEDLNFEVKPGQMVAIVGPTGAGKTTLINLLMRFYDVTGGAIKIDGLDTKQLKREEVRSLFGMVLQDAWLYHDTIMENIRFGKLDATDYEVVDAAKAANVDHFIRTMPEGYKMMIDEEADNVSLGQKQLLTIARALLSDPKILILDEATSSVDTRLELLIQKAMQKVMEGRTSFVIAHRLSTIREADLILVMDQGQIIEQGTHEQLLARGGFYEKLYNSQFGEGEPSD